MRGIAFALVVAGMVGTNGAALASPRYYVAVRDVVDPQGKKTAFTDEVRATFVDMLKRRGDVSLDPPADLTQQRLAKLKMLAYEASVKLETIEQKFDLARHSLACTVRLTIHGNTLPDKEMKIGGHGEAATSVVIAANADVDAAAKKLYKELVDVALTEAIDATVKKIELVNGPR